MIQELLDRGEKFEKDRDRLHWDTIKLSGVIKNYIFDHCREIKPSTHTELFESLRYETLELPVNVVRNVGPYDFSYLEEIKNSIRRDDISVCIFDNGIDQSFLDVTGDKYSIININCESIRNDKAKVEFLVNINLKSGVPHKQYKIVLDIDVEHMENWIVNNKDKNVSKPRCSQYENE